MKLAACVKANRATKTKMILAFMLQNILEEFQLALKIFRCCFYKAYLSAVFCNAYENQVSDHRVKSTNTFGRYSLSYFFWEEYTTYNKYVI